MKRYDDFSIGDIVRRRTNKEMFGIVIVVDETKPNYPYSVMWFGDDNPLINGYTTEQLIKVSS
jgi:hypothetical protein